MQPDYVYILHYPPNGLSAVGYRLSVSRDMIIG